MSWYRSQLESWLKTLDIKADLVYDVGGAQGEVKSRVKSWDVKDYKVLDLPEYDLEKNTLHMAGLPQADVVFCLEVFEYLIDPLRAMVNIKRLLKKNGRAYVTFAFVYPYHNEADLDSLRYTENGIIRLANCLKLKIKQVWYRVDRSGLLQQFYAADGMHPVKGYAHHNASGFIVEFVK